MAANQHITAMGLAGIIRSPHQGYETVWEYFQRTEPEAFGLMLDPLGGLFPHDREAWRISTELATPVVPTGGIAPDNTEEGLPVGAFATVVLERVFAAF